MANTFKSVLSSTVTAQTTVYTCPSVTQTTAIGLSLANTSTSLATVSVTILRSSVTTHVIKNAQVPVGDTLILFGGDQKLVLQSADQLKVQSDNSVDVILSILEIA
jgi:hypothetical protein